MSNHKRQRSIPLIKPNFRDVNDDDKAALKNFSLLDDTEVPSSSELLIEQPEQSSERRSLVIGEIFKTETTYVEYLQVAINFFKKPLESTGTLSADKVNQIFQNITDLHDINAELLKKMALRKAQKKGNDLGSDCWGDLLKETFADPAFREAYQKYINGYNQAMDCLTKYTRKGGKNTQAGNWIQHQLTKNSRACRDLASLSAFLISPVQRLPRYLLFLKDLSKCTPNNHPDYENVKESSNILSGIMSTIDREKLRYDEVCQIEGIYQKFPLYDRQHIPEMTHPDVKLITQGPILVFDTESSSCHTRYLLLFSNIMVCAKKKKQTLNFRWKVNLYKTFIRLVERGAEGEDPHFIITEVSKKAEYPYTTETSYTLFTFADAPEFDFEFWKSQFASIPTHLSNCNSVFSNGHDVVVDLQPSLFVKRDWDLLALGASMQTVSYGTQILAKGTPLTHLYYINSGICRAELDKGNVISLLNDGDFFGEISYLKITSESTANIFVESDKALLTKISFDRLTSVLSGNAGLARRFFHLLAIVSARNYLRRACIAQTTQENNSETPVTSRKTEEKKDVLNSPSDKASRTKSKRVNQVLVKLKLDEEAPDEEILQEFPCKLKKTKFYGQFYVLKQHIGFYSSVFGKKTRIAIPGRSITEVVPRDDYCIYINNLKHNVGPFELQFKSKTEKEEAYTILASFLSDQKRSLAAKTGVNYTAANALARQGSFYQIPEQTWAEVLSTEREYAQGELIVQQGVVIDKIFQILDGRCKIEMDTPDGPIVVGYAGPGEVLGEMSFLLGVVSSCRVSAEDNVFVASVSRVDAEAALNAEPTFAIAFYKFFARTASSRLRKIEMNSLDYEPVVAPTERPKKVDLLGPASLTQLHSLPSNSSGSAFCNLDELMARDDTVIARKGSKVRD